MKKLLIILGAVLILMSLLLTIVYPVIGIIGIIAGIAVIIYGRKYQPKPAEHSPVSAAAPAPRLYFEYRLSGYDYIQDVLEALLVNPNSLYDMSKSDLIEMEMEYGGYEDEYQYEFDTAEIPCECKVNEDSIFVYAASSGKRIGTVAKKDRETVAKMLDAPGVEYHAEIFGGRFKVLRCESESLDFDKIRKSDYSLETGESPYKSSLIITLPNDK